ncbi:uncharacterized protein C1orf105 homolog [Bubalus kerabau]|uniref:uncharacterized protein C1orf105 homolog n=1 Tax=Bubalus carabanensis TaxID=3119969 RepID=UPI001D11884C|nr:uncharacterized protein C1orf105 homolog [Bubalus carabanensis]
MRERPGLGFHGCNTLMWPLDGSQEQQLQRPALQAEPGRLVSEQTREVTSPSLLLRQETQAGWNQNDPTLIRNKQLCSTCRDVKMVQPKTLIIPDDLKLSFANIMNHRMMSLHQPKAQTVPKRSRDDILTENVHYRLPILGPRTAVFHRLLSDAYETLQETQLSSLPRKEPVSKAVSQ